MCARVYVYVCTSLFVNVCVFVCAGMSLYVCARVSMCMRRGSMRLCVGARSLDASHPIVAADDAKSRQLLEHKNS